METQPRIRAFQRTIKSSTLEHLRTAIENREHEYRQYCCRSSDAWSDVVRRLTMLIHGIARVAGVFGVQFELALDVSVGHLDIKMPAGSTPIDVDAVSAQGKGKAGVNGWPRHLVITVVVV